LNVIDEINHILKSAVNTKDIVTQKVSHSFDWSAPNSSSLVITKNNKTNLKRFCTSDRFNVDSFNVVENSENRITDDQKMLNQNLGFYVNFSPLEVAKNYR